MASKASTAAVSSQQSAAVPGIYIEITHFLCQSAGDGALAGAGRAVNGDRIMLCHNISFFLVYKSYLILDGVLPARLLPG